MLDRIAHAIAGSRAGRYWLGKLSNHPAFQPLYNAMADRVAASLRLLAKAGYAPALVVDVGGHAGDWTRMARGIFPAARFLMIEAQPEKERVLANLCATDRVHFDYSISLLGPENRESADFFLADLGSSLYVENTSAPRERISLPMLTLDAVVAQHGAPGGVFLKLDVQGAELDVLAGANETLARCDAILLEASLAEYNLGAPRIAETMVRMKELGFVLYDICDLQRIGPVLAQTDLLFVRVGSVVEQSAGAAIRGFGA